jgi:P-type Ca2+ transporter type 2C
MSSAAPAWEAYWCRDSTAAVCPELGVSPDRSVSLNDAPRQQREYPTSKLSAQPHGPVWKALLRQYRELMQIVMIGVAVISGRT